MNDYRAFLEQKIQVGGDSGFAPVWMPDFLFDFQAALVEWSLLKGRAALFEDCGLGKTPQQLVWSENVVRRTNKRVLIATPLAVSGQTVREAEKFGIEAHRSNDGRAHKGITVTNYERLHLFNANDFIGVVCDESSILKNFDGVRKALITEFLRTRPYRLTCTATAAPNDYIEFGTTSEALGYLGHMDMLTKFFKNDQRGVHPNSKWGGGKWRFRGHAQRDFWRWICSWARALRRPSDLGFDDGRFVLPRLITHEHVVETKADREGMLFKTPAITLHEQRAERRKTMRERCERVAALVADTGKPFVSWCHLNEEGDLLERLIPDAVQVSGADPDEAKEEAFIAFEQRQVRGIITKDSIAGFGLNWQHCAHQTVFPSHSFERFYQCTRRFLRFGQTSDVTTDMVTSEGEAGVLANLMRKGEQLERAFANLVEVMNSEYSIDTDNLFRTPEVLPAWL